MQNPKSGSLPIPTFVELEESSPEIRPAPRRVDPAGCFRTVRFLRVVGRAPQFKRGGTGGPARAQPPQQTPCRVSLQAFKDRPTTSSQPRPPTSAPPPTPPPSTSSPPPPPTGNVTVSQSETSLVTLIPNGTTHSNISSSASRKIRTAHFKGTRRPAVLLHNSQYQPKEHSKQAAGRQQELQHSNSKVAFVCA
ncbi:hypothetical protein THAOC_15357 [Thalassiosira oceanica]|uniref:Uncharacterized protein n=1 Tax=Thalassiosira oceanica TaxID=159749 RepID=K0SF12_THAOC|nr:hypothetical protein THAOC_15357 [Thalassiosira oceanica]|eukprot:EJK63960.1 hypothetical protein THAOC_15357 [Thalassiosira oceanica]